jgi:hypothetical protein
MRVIRRRAAVAVLAAATMGASGIAVAENAQAATQTCNGRVMKAGVVDTDAMGGYVYGLAGIPTRDGSLDCRLARGDSTGTDVATSAVFWLQRTLNECYGAGLLADGNFGPQTRTAVEAVQRKLGIAQDGVYGPNTRDNMVFYTERMMAHGALRTDCIPLHRLV